MSNLPFVRLQDSIATRLLTVVFSIYFLVTLSVTAIHMTAEYYQTKASVIRDLAMFEKTFSSGLANALWDMNDEQIQSALAGIIQLPIVVGVELYRAEAHEVVAQAGILPGPDGNYIKVDAKGGQLPLEANAQRFNSLFSYRFPLVYTVLGSPTIVGEGVLYSSTAIVFEKVQYGFMFIIVNSIIKTLALWIIFLWVGRKLLSQPLARLTAATDQINLDNLENLQIDVQTQGRNELKILEEAFNTMIQKLRLAKYRAASLRVFSNKIADFQDSIQCLRFAFDELQLHLGQTQGMLLFHPQEGHFTEIYPPEAPGQNWQNLIDSELQHLIFRETQEVCALNHLSVDHPLAQSYRQHTEMLPPGEHWLFARASGLPDHLFIFTRPSGSPIFDSVDVEYLRSMINEVEITHRNLHTIREHARMEGELRTAAAVQHALLPKNLPIIPQVELATFFESASETGGDWYGFVTKMEHFLYIMIGDVTGHGIPAALVTAAASATCQILEEIFAQQQRVLSPSEFLHYVNQAVFNAGAPNFLMTFFIARLDLETGRVTFSNAGHNFPIVVSRSGKVSHLINANSHLGRKPETEFTEGSMQLQEGDTLLMFTDGLIENTNPQGEMWGESRLVRHLKKYRNIPATHLVKHLVQDVYLFYGDRPLEDDMTMVACQIVRAFPAQAPLKDL